MEMTNIKLEDIKADPRLQTLTYFYVIHGTIPEIMPDVACRLVGTKEQYQRKILKCPYCYSRLTDADKDTRVELYAHTHRITVKCQLYLKCDICHNEVGINVA
jgi:hypothetical protein